MNEILNIDGIECYEENGTAYLKLEAVARGLGFIENKNGKIYIKWDRIRKMLNELSFDTSVETDIVNCFIPENIFYRLAMKAKNEVAEAFQAKVADEIIPSIRKRGAYMTPDTIDKMIASPEFGIRLLTALKNEQNKRKELELDNQIMKPKAEYFDALVDRNLLTNFRDTAKELGVKEREFINYLLNKRYIYRDKKGKLKPYADKNSGLFEVKEFVNKETGFASVQTLITPKGRETFRLLCTAI
ncbi:MAG: phage repressor protein/antirepressor Ant [Firmicutes bacterium]|nr:phage repressor protein/antirepressor Ant [Bacillota bacterium]